ncbi:hypothetical protein [Nocardioides albidus]|uniref:hypothetical protein n=1 Tax=Nocardioides albidus TaxID=1517589 RepID=UPI0013054297|nr:hypothetical protein [Nocardioides albidus]
MTLSSIRPAVAPALLLVLAGLSGCAGDQDRDRAVADVAQRFEAAVEAGDGDQACRLLAPATRDALERDAQEPCADALLEEDLPPAGDKAEAEAEAEVYGTAAQVRTGSDTLFLGRFDRGWRVTAAGCQAAGDAPYECAVEGG